MFFPQRDTSYTDHSSTPNFPSLCLSCLSPFTLKLSFSCLFRFVLWSAEFNQRHLWDHALGIFSRSLAGLAVATQLNIMVSPLSDSCNIQLFSSKQWVAVRSSPFYEWLLMWPASCRSNANSYSHMTQDCNDCTEYRGYHFWVLTPSLTYFLPSLHYVPWALKELMSIHVLFRAEPSAFTCLLYESLAATILWSYHYLLLKREPSPVKADELYLWL